MPSRLELGVVEAGLLYAVAEILLDVLPGEIRGEAEFFREFAGDPPVGFLVVR
jgi:hypothetical protein